MNTVSSERFFYNLSAYLLEPIVVPDDGLNNAKTRRTVAQEF